MSCIIRRGLLDNAPMKLLAIDTGTEALSIAVSVTQAHGTRVWSHEGAAGAAASTTLVPAVMQLLLQAEVRLTDLDAIAFGAGPGSFTGLRTACAVAQGLAFGAGLPVLPVDSLLAVAEQARFVHAPTQSTCCVTAVLDARMDEVYAATYCYAQGRWHNPVPAVLLAPQNVARWSGWLAQQHGPWWLAGNAFAEYGARLGSLDPAAATAARVPALPKADALLRLAPSLLAEGAAVRAEQALPLYVRDKVAKTTAERAADKAHASAGQA